MQIKENRLGYWGIPGWRAGCYSSKGRAELCGSGRSLWESSMLCLVECLWWGCRPAVLTLPHAPWPRREKGAEVVREPGALLP